MNKVEPNCLNSNPHFGASSCAQCYSQAVVCISTPKVLYELDFHNENYIPMFS